MTREDQNLIRRFKTKDNSALEIFYRQNLSAFSRFSKQYDIEEQEVKDIYQDAVIAVYENAQKGKLDTLEARLSTYLFSVGKYMIFQKLKRKNKLYIDDLNYETTAFPDLDVDEDTNTNRIQEMSTAFTKLGFQCQEVLRLFYYEEKNMDEIMQILNYSNKDVLKSQKSRCLKKLKEILNTK